MWSQRTLFFALLSLLLGSTGCTDGAGQTYDVRIRDVTLTVEVAETAESRTRGLMFRESLPEDHGMLFVFPESRRRSFWMKNTLIPLSIAYIREDWVILEIYEMEPESLEPIQSRNPAQYALEVNQGFFAERGIEPGARLFPSEELRSRIE